MRKFKILVSAIFAFIFVGIFAISVYALKSVSLSTRGKIQLKTHYADAWVSGSVANAYDSDGQTVQNVTALGLTRVWEGDTSVDWNINSAMYFGDVYATELSELEMITITITVYNNSNFRLKAEPTLEFTSNADKVTTNEVETLILDPYEGEKIEDETFVSNLMPHGEIVIEISPLDMDTDFVASFVLGIELNRINQLPAPRVEVEGTTLSISPVEGATSYEIYKNAGGTSTLMTTVGANQVNNIDFSQYMGLTEVCTFSVVAKDELGLKMSSDPVVCGEYETVTAGDVVSLDIDGDGETEHYKLLNKLDGATTTWEVIGMYDASASAFGNDNTYVGSDVDTYLNTTLYNSLPDNVKSAIVPKEITQDSWWVPSTIVNGSYIYDNSTYDFILSKSEDTADPITRNVRALSIEDLNTYLYNGWSNYGINNMLWNNGNSPSNASTIWLSSANVEGGGFAYDPSTGKIVPAATNQQHSTRAVFDIDIDNVVIDNTSSGFYPCQFNSNYNYMGNLYKANLIDDDGDGKYYVVYGTVNGSVDSSIDYSNILGYLIKDENGNYIIADGNGDEAYIDNCKFRYTENNQVVEMTISGKLVRSNDNWSNYVVVEDENGNILRYGTNNYQIRLGYMEVDHDDTEETYRVLGRYKDAQDNYTNVFQLMTMYDIGPVAFNESIVGVSSNGKDGSKTYLGSRDIVALSNPQNASNLYAGSTLDTYLNTTWYNTLSQQAKSAIVANTSAQSYWYFDDLGIHVYSGGNNEMEAASYYQNLPGNRIQYMTENENSGTSTIKEYPSTSGHLLLYTQNESEAITRKIYTFSLSDILDMLGTTEEMTGINTNLRYWNLIDIIWDLSDSGIIWLSSAYYDGTDDANKALYLNNEGKIGFAPISENFSVIPVFQLDLSLVQVYPPVKGDLVAMDLDGDGNNEYYRVLKNVEDNTYEVMAMDSSDSNTMFNQYYNTYEGSNVDVYLNQTWYNTLTESAREAIEPRTIWQDTWTRWSGSSTNAYNSTSRNRGSGSSSKYCLTLNSTGTGDGFERNVYALSISDILSSLDAQISTSTSTNAFTYSNLITMFWHMLSLNSSSSSNSNYKIWLRSGSNISNNTLIIDGYYGEINNRDATIVGALRPAFQIDLTDFYSGAIAKGDRIQLNLDGTSRNYYVLNNVHDNVWQILAQFNVGQNIVYTASNNVYEDSNVESFLSEFYDGFSRTAKAAIVSKTFAQDSWQRYYPEDEDELVNGYYTGDGFLIQKDVQYGTTITREVYTLSVKDIIDYLDLPFGVRIDLSDEIGEYLNDCQESIDNMFFDNGSGNEDFWLMSADDGNDGYIFCFGNHNIYSTYSYINNLRVRPVFQIDLSMIDYTVLNSLPYVAPVYEAPK